MASLGIGDILIALVGLILFIVFMSLLQTLIRGGWFLIVSQIRKIFKFLTGSAEPERPSSKSEMPEED